MKKAFAECHKAVLACEDETGRKRCELFRELPDKRVRVRVSAGVSTLLTQLAISGLSRLLPADHTAYRDVTTEKACQFWSLQNRSSFQG